MTSSTLDSLVIISVFCGLWGEKRREENFVILEGDRTRTGVILYEVVGSVQN